MLLYTITDDTISSIKCICSYMHTHILVLLVNTAVLTVSCHGIACLY